MAYSGEIRRKAENLYIVEGLSLREIAKQLNISNHHTVFKWSKEEDWEKKRHEIDTKSTRIAENRAIERLAKDKSKYKEENLRLLDGYKIASSIFIKYILDELQNIDRNSDDYIATLTRLVDWYSKAAKATVAIVKSQDDMLFGKTHESINEGMNITANDIYVALIRKDPEALRKIQGS